MSSFAKESSLIGLVDGGGGNELVVRETSDSFGRESVVETGLRCGDGEEAGGCDSGGSREEDMLAWDSVRAEDNGIGAGVTGASGALLSFKGSGAGFSSCAMDADKASAT